MVSVIFRVKVQPGKEKQAEEALRKMVASVEKEEPKTLAYTANTLHDDALQVIFFEAYADQDAFEAHMQTPHMAEMRAAFSEIFDTATVKIERLQQVAGFTRAG